MAPGFLLYLFIILAAFISLSSRCCGVVALDARDGLSIKKGVGGAVRCFFLSIKMNFNVLAGVLYELGRCLSPNYPILLCLQR